MIYLEYQQYELFLAGVLQGVGGRTGQKMTAAVQVDAGGRRAKSL